MGTSDSTDDLPHEGRADEPVAMLVLGRTTRALKRRRTVSFSKPFELEWIPPTERDRLAERQLGLPRCPERAGLMSEISWQR